MPTSIMCLGVRTAPQTHVLERWSHSWWSFLERVGRYGHVRGDASLWADFEVSRHPPIPSMLSASCFLSCQLLLLRPLPPETLLCRSRELRPSRITSPKLSPTSSLPTVSYHSSGTHTITYCINVRKTLPIKTLSVKPNFRGCGSSSLLIALPA